MIFTSYTKFSHFLLSIILKDKSQRPYLDILYMSTLHNNKGTMQKRLQFKPHFAITFKSLIPKIMIEAIIWFTLPCLPPHTY